MPAAALPEIAGADTAGLSASQREMLETGLRFVRSSLTMNVQEPTDDVVSRRSAALRELDDLERRFAMKPR